MTFEKSLKSTITWDNELKNYPSTASLIRELLVAEPLPSPLSRRDPPS